MGDIVMGIVIIFAVYATWMMIGYRLEESERNQ